MLRIQTRSKQKEWHLEGHQPKELAAEICAGPKKCPPSSKGREQDGAPGGAIVRIPFQVYLRASEREVLRLRRCFASRSIYFAQDDMVARLYG